MEQSFEDALMELLDRYADTPIDERISAVELRLMALREEEEEAGGEE